MSPADICKATGSNEVLKVSMTKRDERDAADWEGRFAAIEAEAAAILKAEGEHHVNGTYFVEAGDAYMARMVAAEQVVARRDESMDRYRAKTPALLTDAELALRMVQHTAKVCSLVTDAMGVKS